MTQNEIVNSIDMEFVLIPAGMFVLGLPDSDPDANDWEKPAHQVTISQPFYLGKYPVTQGQWQAVMGSNPSRFKGEHRPVEFVSWKDVQAFMQKLNERESLRTYRLPTEAEWEYACRAGTTTRYSFGNDDAQLDEYAWYDENSSGATHWVGQKKPNAWGLYDIHGNVYEWVRDRYGKYRAEAVSNPSGPMTGANRVVRGGSWIDPAQGVRSAHRRMSHPGDQIDVLGFRCLSSRVNQ